MIDDDTESRLAVQHDLKLTEAWNFQLYIGIKQLHSGVLDGPCKTFQKNIERVSALSTVQQMMARSATRHVLMLCQATFNVTGKPVMNDSEVEINQPAVSAEYDRVAIREVTGILPTRKKWSSLS